MTDSPSILVVRVGALGDLLLTVQALQALRQRYPQATIRGAGYTAVAPLLRAYLDEAISLDSPRCAGLLEGDVAPPVLDGVDTAVLWTSRDRTAALQRWGIPMVIHASPYPPPGVHAATWYLYSLVPLIGTAPRPTPHLTPAREDRAAAVATLRALGLTHPVVLHPGAGAAWKRWPAERFAELGDALRSHGREVVLTEGPADNAAIDEVQQAAAAPFPVARDLSVPQLAGLLGEARAMVGNDSGVTHLAALIGIPTVAIFGPTDPAQWSPLGKVRVLRGCREQARTQGEVRVCHHDACLTSVSVKAVLDALEHRG